VIFFLGVYLDLTTLERLAVEKRAQLEQIKADLAALERTLAMSRSPAITPTTTHDPHAGRPAGPGFAVDENEGRDVVPSKAIETSRRGAREEALPAVIERVLENAEHDMTPIEIHRVITATGRTIHPNAVTSHLSRLVRRGRIKKTGPSLYTAIKSETRHETVEGNGRLDWNRQAPSGEEEMISSIPSDTIDEKRDLGEENASPGRPGEAF
jgi:hypothetical protein